MCCMVVQTLVLQPQIEPGPPELEAQSLNHWAAREAPLDTFFALHFNFANQQTLRLVCVCVSCFCHV